MLRFEDKIEEINKALRGRRGRWFFNAVAWLDYDDVCQIIRKHIYVKWDKWNQELPFGPWVGTLIDHQITNILRNNYSNFAKPCSGCPFNQSVLNPISKTHSQYCGFTKSGLQCEECPLYAKWKKKKENAYNVKLPFLLENKDLCALEIYDTQIDIDRCVEDINTILQVRLTEHQYRIYHMLYIEGIDKKIVREKLGYKNDNKGRRAGDKQINKLEKIFVAKVKKILANEEVRLQ
jgi:hypothetical protein